MRYYFEAVDSERLYSPAKVSPLVRDGVGTRIQISQTPKVRHLRTRLYRLPGRPQMEVPFNNLDFLNYVSKAAQKIRS